MAAFALLHGGGQGSWVWRDTAAALEAAGAEVVLLDVPGCGTKRDRDTTELTPDDVVAELIEDIAASGIVEPLVLVGHSQGGTLLPLLWRAAPDRFHRLVYFAACAPLPDQSIVDMMGRSLHGADPATVGWLIDPDANPPAAVRRAGMGNDMDAAQLATFEAEDGQDHWPMPVTFWADWSYAGLEQAPGTYVVCERDGMLPIAWQERFAERFRVQRTVRIDAGHQAMMTQPERLTALLLAEAAG